jgi:hypothetical protein
MVRKMFMEGSGGGGNCRSQNDIDGIGAFVLVPCRGERPSLHELSNNRPQYFHDDTT